MTASVPLCSSMARNQCAPRLHALTDPQIRTPTHIHAHTRTYTHIHAHIRTYTHIHAHTRPYTPIHAHRPARPRTHMPTRAQVRAASPCSSAVQYRSPRPRRQAHVVRPETPPESWIEDGVWPEPHTTPIDAPTEGRQSPTMYERVLAELLPPTPPASGALLTEPNLGRKLGASPPSFRRRHASREPSPPRAGARADVAASVETLTDEVVSATHGWVTAVRALTGPPHAYMAAPLVVPPPLSKPSRPRVPISAHALSSLGQACCSPPMVRFLSFSIWAAGAWGARVAVPSTRGGRRHDSSAAPGFVGAAEGGRPAGDPSLHTRPACTCEYGRRPTGW